MTAIAQILVLMLVITGPVTLMVVLGIALLSTQRLSQGRWQQGVAALVLVGVVAIPILTPLAWRWASWARITIESATKSGGFP